MTVSGTNAGVDTTRTRRMRNRGIQRDPRLRWNSETTEVSDRRSDHELRASFEVGSGGLLRNSRPDGLISYVIFPQLQDGLYADDAGSDSAPEAASAQARRRPLGGPPRPPCGMPGGETGGRDGGRALVRRRRNAINMLATVDPKQWVSSNLCCAIYVVQSMWCNLIM